VMLLCRNNGRVDKSVWPVIENRIDSPADSTKAKNIDSPAGSKSSFETCCFGNRRAEETKTLRKCPCQGTLRSRTETSTERGQRLEHNRLAQRQSRAKKSEAEKEAIRTKQRNFRRRDEERRRLATVESRNHRAYLFRESFKERRKGNEQKLTELWNSIPEGEKERVLENHQRQYADDVRKMALRRPVFRVDALRKCRFDARKSLLMRRTNRQTAPRIYPSKSLCSDVFQKDTERDTIAIRQILRNLKQKTQAAAPNVSSSATDVHNS